MLVLGLDASRFVGPPRRGLLTKGICSGCGDTIGNVNNDHLKNN